MKAIILAGGFGTRLQSVVKDVPKPMANIKGKPFLEYLLIYLRNFHVDEVILSVGYKQEIIKDYFKNAYKEISIQYSCEESPLGTGGAIKKALKLLDTQENILILNGDTFFQLNLNEFYKAAQNSSLTLALKPMKNFNRYGNVIVKNNKIISFQEKVFVTEGLINAGVYLLKKNILDKVDIKSFSFEDFLSQQKNLNYYKENSYFVDIGIPKDYEQAQVDFKEFF